jgi:hypothetical protein
MPARAANLVIRYSGTDEITEAMQSIATELGFHHHVSHVHEAEDESLLIFQPFEDTDQNRRLIGDCMERLGDEISSVEVSLKETGDTNHPDDPVSVQYLIVVEQTPESRESVVNIPKWL